MRDEGNSTTNSTNFKIMIEMDSNGNYTIKEWQDPNQNYELDGLILEIFKNQDGHLQLIHWTEDDLMNMFSEMKQYWENEDFWDQVMVGYTDLTKE